MPGLFASHFFALNGPIILLVICPKLDKSEQVSTSTKKIYKYFIFQRFGFFSDFARVLQRERRNKESRFGMGDNTLQRPAWNNCTWTSLPWFSKFLYHSILHINWLNNCKNFSTVVPRSCLKALKVRKFAKNSENTVHKMY